MEVNEIVTMDFLESPLQNTGWKDSGSSIFNLFLQGVMGEGEEFSLVPNSGETVEETVAALPDITPLESADDLPWLEHFSAMVAELVQSLLPDMDLENLSPADKAEILEIIDDLNQELYTQLGNMLVENPQLLAEQELADLSPKLQEFIADHAELNVDKMAKITEALHYLRNVSANLEKEATRDLSGALSSESGEGEEAVLQLSDIAPNLKTTAPSFVDVRETVVSAEFNIKPDVSTSKEATTPLAPEAEVADLSAVEKPQLRSTPASRFTEKETSVDFNGENRATANLTELHQQDAKIMVKSVEDTARLDMNARIDTFKVVQQISTKVAGLIDLNENKMTMRLDPPELGKVHLEIEFKPGELKVQMVVESQTVKDLLESSVSQLRDSLEKQQIKIDGLEVSVNQEELNNPTHARQEEFAKRARRMRMSVNTGTKIAKEVVVNAPGSDTGRRLGYNSMEIIA